MLDQRTGTIKTGGIAGLSQNRRHPDRTDPGDAACQLGELKLVKDLQHASFHLRTTRLDCAPILEHPAAALQGAPTLRAHPGRIGQGGKDRGDNPSPGLLATPVRQLSTHRGLKPNQAKPFQPLRTAVAARQHHRQGSTPDDRIKLSHRCAQHRRPGALQQIPHLLHARGRLGDQAFPARS